MEQLTEQQIKEFHEAFTLFDREGKGQVKCKELGTLMRSLGQNPSEAQLKSIAEDIGKSGKDNVNFEDFLKLMSRQIKQADTEEDIREAFKIFDRDSTGYIDAAELRRVLTSSGEKLSHEEVDELLKEVNIDANGRIVYQDFVNMITSK